MLVAVRVGMRMMRVRMRIVHVRNIRVVALRRRRRQVGRCSIRFLKKQLGITSHMHINIQHTN